MSEDELTAHDVDITIRPIYAALKRTWNNFCAKSSIHGLKYTRDKDTNSLVRSVWILISIIMFICAIVMVHRFYFDYRSSMTRMNLENDFAPVTSLYFPSITICPEVLFNYERAQKFIPKLILPKGIDVDYVLFQLRIFSGFMVDDENFEPDVINTMENILELNNLTFKQFMTPLRWQCANLIHRCRYYGDIVDCDELFQSSLTFYGHCCSFNIIQDGLNYTRKSASFSLPFGLSLILRYKDENYNAINTYSNGFKLIIQETEAYPSAHGIVKFMALNTEHFVAIRTEEVFCSRAVEQLSIDERNCVFPYEIPLTYFSTYVGTNCELNCRVTMMVKFCGCHTYFFEFNRTQDRICSFRDIPCLVENFANIITRERKNQCHCPNVCEYFQYDVQVSDAKLYFDMPTADAFYDGIKEDDAVAHIFLNSQFYRRIKRDLLSNMVTLVSDLGSAFSLFVGMSMLSVVEIIYYFTVILRKYYKQECKAREQLLFRRNVKLAEILKEMKANIDLHKEPKENKLERY